MNWLFKEEPTNYSYDALARDGKTSWTGVRNPARAEALASSGQGRPDLLLSHRRRRKSVVGIMKAAGDAYPDPADTTGKLYAVDVVPVQKLTQPVTLGAIKADKAFATFPLVPAVAAVGDARDRRGVDAHREDERRMKIRDGLTPV